MMEFIRSKKMMVAVLLVVSMLSASGCALMPEEEEAAAPVLIEPKENEYVTITTERSDITDDLTVGANFVAEESQQLYFKIGGSRISHIYVKVGDEVTAGQVLMELENDDLTTSYQMAVNNYKAQKINYENIKNGTHTAADITAAKTACEQAEAEVETLKAQRSALALEGNAAYVAEQTQVIRQCEITVAAANEKYARLSADLEAAESELMQAQLDKDNAETALAAANEELLLRQQGLGSRYDELTAQISAGEKHAAELRKTYENMVNYKPNANQLELARISMDNARLSMEQAERKLGETKLISQIDGVVTYLNLAYNVGDTVVAYEPVIKLSNPQGILLEYQGDKAESFVMNQDVTFTYMGAEYPGSVIMTPREAPVGTEAKNIVRFSFDQLPDAKLGDLVQVRVVLKESKDAIVLPTNVIHTYLNRKYVLILEDGVRYERDVELGIQTPTHVEIVSGLEEGEQVIQN